MERVGFEGWLRRGNLVADHQAPHYSRWVDRFVRLRSTRPEKETWQDTLAVHG